MLLEMKFYSFELSMIKSNEVDFYYLAWYKLYTNFNDNYTSGRITVYIPDDIKWNTIVCNMTNADCVVIYFKLKQ